MIRLERNGLIVEDNGYGHVMVSESDEPTGVWLDADAARWLQAVALPAALDDFPADAPSEPSENVGPATDQTTIDEMFERA